MHVRIRYTSITLLGGPLILLNILRMVKDHENHARWIYRTPVQHGKSRKYARIHPSHIVCWHGKDLRQIGSDPIHHNVLVKLSGDSTLYQLILGHCYMVTTMTTWT